MARTRDADPTAAEATEEGTAVSASQADTVMGAAEASATAAGAHDAQAARGADAAMAGEMARPDVSPDGAVTAADVAYAAAPGEDVASRPNGPTGATGAVLSLWHRAAEGLRVAG